MGNCAGGGTRGTAADFVEPKAVPKQQNGSGQNSSRELDEATKLRFKQATAVRPFDASTNVDYDVITIR
jgi:hypothetical protein